MFTEPFNFSFCSITGWGIDLDYHDIEWFALETNRDHSFIFEIASKYCILDCFVDHDSYSISSKLVFIVFSNNTFAVTFDPACLINN